MCWRCVDHDRCCCVSKSFGQMKDKIKRSEFQLPLGDLGLELAAHTKDPQSNGHGIGCQIRGWKHIPNRSTEISAAMKNLPIGSRIIVVDGEYVENMLFREIAKRIKASHERIIIVEYEVNEDCVEKRNSDDVRKKEMTNTHLSQDILNVLDDDQSDTTEDDQRDHRDERHLESRRQWKQQQQQQKKKKDQLHLDGKLYLLQGQVEKATIQLKESQQHSIELENVIKLQTKELEKKQNDILHLKTSQRETDGQVMLLRYRLDKSQSTQQRLQLLTNGESHGTLIPLSSSEIIIASEVKEDRFSFLSHVRKFSSSLQQIRKRFQSNVIPLEEIDGIASLSPVMEPSPSLKRIDPKSLRGEIQPPVFLSQTRSNLSGSRDFLPKEVEVLSESKSDYRQDEFSEFIRSKLGLGRTELFSSHSVEWKPEPLDKEETNHHPSKVSRRSDVVHGTSVPHSSSHPQPQSQSSSRRGSFNHRSQFQVESQLIHEEVQRFRNFMNEMRVDCAVPPPRTPSFFSSSSSRLPQDRPQQTHFSHTTRTSFKPSVPLSSSRSNTATTATTTSFSSSSSLWKSSLNASVGFEDESLLDSRTQGTDLNFSHLGKISTSPPLSHSRNPPSEVSPLTFNFTSL